MNLFNENKGGKVSSRRLLGFIIIIFSLILAGVDTFSDNKVNDTIWIAMFTGGVSMIISTVIPNKNIN